MEISARPRLQTLWYQHNEPHRASIGPTVRRTAARPEGDQPLWQRLPPIRPARRSVLPRSRLNRPLHPRLWQRSCGSRLDHPQVRRLYRHPSDFCSGGPLSRILLIAFGGQRMPHRGRLCHPEEVENARVIFGAGMNTLSWCVLAPRALWSCQPGATPQDYGESSISAESAIQGTGYPLKPHLAQMNRMSHAD